MTAPRATLQRLNPGVDEFLARLINPLALRDVRQPLQSRRRFPSPQARVAGQREIEAGHDSGHDDSGGASDSDPDSDAEAEDMDTSSDDEFVKKPAARKRRVAKAVARPGPAKGQDKGKGQKLGRPVSAIATSKSIAVHCDSYVPQSVLSEMPRDIVENLKTESTHSKGNNNIKNLYDVLHLLSKGEIKRAILEDKEYKNFRAGIKKGGVNMAKRWETYKKKIPSLPTCDFYILVHRDANPLKSVFLKMTLPFGRKEPNNCLLPKEFLHELGATFLLAPGSDTTKMTFTDVAAGSPGYGYKFNLPVYDDDAAGSSDAAGSNERVTFAFMVELSIIKDGTVDEFIPAPLLPNFAIPVVASSATGLERAPPPPPAFEAPPALPPASAPAVDPPAADPPAADPPAADPPAPDPPAADPPAAEPGAAEPGAAEPALSGASGGAPVEPSRAEPPTPVNEKDFWSLAPNYSMIRSKVFAVLRTTRNVNIDDVTCTALDDAFKMLVMSKTRYNDEQMVTEVVKRMKVTLKWYL